MKRTLLCTTAACLALQVSPAAALDQPVVWRDEDTGCAYLLTPQGGISPRHRRDGTLDCPGAAEARSGLGIVDSTAREIAKGLDRLQQEIERLRDRYNEGR
jgi:hypothetical protein